MGRSAQPTPIGSMSMLSPVRIDSCTARPINVARALAIAPGPAGPVPRIAAANACGLVGNTGRGDIVDIDTVDVDHSIGGTHSNSTGRQQVDQQRALRSEDLGAHVVAEAAVARQVDRRHAPPSSSSTATRLSTSPTAANDSSTIGAA